MYTLTDTNQTNPFAIITKNDKHLVHLATKEEFCLDEISMESFDFPNTFETVYVKYVGNYDGEDVKGEVMVQQLIDY